MTSPPLSRLSHIKIYDKAFYENIQSDILNFASKVVSSANIHATVLGQQPGLARLMNLATWRSDGAHEYLDQDAIAGDVVIHVACHQAVHQRFGSDETRYQLLGEAIASASDFYLVGLFANAGVEFAFLEETLESFSFYFESYGEISQLESILELAMANPNQLMADLARYLFEFTACFLSKEPLVTQISQMAAHAFYPLVHHYHVTNWVLNLRNQAIGQTLVIEDRVWETLGGENGLPSLLNLSQRW